MGAVISVAPPVQVVTGVHWLPEPFTLKLTLIVQLVHARSDEMDGGVDLVCVKSNIKALGLE